jgi:GNAT superfamily N-acetyltransferase
VDTNNTDPPVKWRPATEADLDDIQRIGDRIHAELPEKREIFAEKLTLFPEGCFVLVQNEIIVGYAFSHPWLLDRIPELNQPLSRLPAKPDCILIHDVAILQQARGRGAAAVLVEIVTKLARERNIANLALVSVYNSYRLWGRFGFELADGDALVEKLKSYGGPARYMVRRLD